MFKMTSFCHLHYNNKILCIYKKSPFINYFCCLRENMDGDVLYLLLSLLGILYYMLTQGTPPDDLELHSEAFAVHLTKITLLC